MPTLLQQDGFRFFFYSNDHDPPHVHVEYGTGSAKVDLMPTIALINSRNMGKKEVKKMLNIITKHHAEFLDAWKHFFNQN